MTQSTRNPDQALGGVPPKKPSGDPARGQPSGGNAQAWYLEQANRGQLLLEQGHIERAQGVFEATLAGLGEEPSYARAVITERLGRCHLMGGQPVSATGSFQQALEITKTIPLTDGVKGLQCTLQSGLGDALRASGQLADARKAYEAALAIAKSLKDRRAQGVDLDHLGTLALTEGRQQEALARYRAALGVFQQIRERAPEAITWHHLGMAFQQAQQWDEAERHYLEAARIMEELGDLEGAAQSRSQLAAVSEKTGRSDAAEAWYRKALEASRHSLNPNQIRRHLNNLAKFLQSRSGRLAEARQLAEEAIATATTIESLALDDWNAYGILADVIDKEAASAEDSATRAAQQAQARNYRHIQEYGPRLQTTLAGLGEEPSYGRAVIMERLGRCCLMGGRLGPAVALFRQAMEVTETIPPSDGVKGLQGVLQSGLGDALSAAGHLGEAHKPYETALKIAEDLKDLRGQGVELGHLITLALAEGRREDASARLQEALRLFQKLHERAPEASTWDHLGMSFEQAQQWDEAQRHHLEAARIREELGDLAGAALSRSQLAFVSEKTGLLEAGQRAPATPAETPAPATRAVSAAACADFEATLYEELTTDCVFATDLLVDVRRESKVLPWTETPDPLSDGVSPMLVPRVRTYLDEEGRLRFCLPVGEPVFEQEPHCVVMRNTRREVAVSGNPDVIWRLIRRMDGAHTVNEMLSEVPIDEREAAARLLAVLAASGAIDVSGRPIAQFLHSATKKGVLLGGGLESDDVLRLATDGDYRAYPEVAHIALAEAVPDRLRGFHVLTRARRSRRDYAGQALRREDFDALLHTACGVTGVMSWAGRELKLRAYPSSGALYAVEIYPVVFRVDGLEPGVYHYAAGENVLDAVRTGVGQDRFVGTALPVERDMVSGAAAMICLVGRFRRHERKYGEGSYRMMVAEAGHISQNLVLSAVALGLTARPFGGVFDGLINQELGLDEAEEQFLLSVLVGHAGGADRPDAQPGQSGDKT